MPTSPQPNALLVASPTASCCPHRAQDAALPTALLSPTKACQICPGTESRSPQAPQQVFLCWPGHGTSLSDSMVTQTWVERPLQRELRPPNQTTDTQEPPKGPNLVPLSDQLLSGVPRAVTCLWFPSSPPGSASCRPDLMQDQGLSLRLCPALPGDSQWDLQAGPRVDGPSWVWYSRSSSGAAL